MLILSYFEGGMNMFDPATKTFKHSTAKNWFIGDNVGALDLQTRKYVVLSGEGKVWRADIDQVNFGNPTSAIPNNQQVSYLETPGTAAFFPPNAQQFGIDYDPDRQRLVCWSGNTDVWTLNTSTWVWHRITSSSGPQTAGKTSGGIYGRWRYLPQHHVFIGYNDWADSPWLYRMP